VKWFFFNQNNSGGYFDFDAVRGISRAVLIQAKNAEEANFKAEAIGIYFDGEDDCPCCGDRWSKVDDAYDGTDDPMVYGDRVEADSKFEKGNGILNIQWMEDRGPEGYMHFKDGTFKGFWKP